MKLLKYFAVVSVLFTLVSFNRLPRAFAFFDQLEDTAAVVITIGDFSFSTVFPWNPNTSYQIGDRFTFDGKLWEVRGFGDYTLPPEGSKLRPFGPYQEVTDEYRSYNTYFSGDIVIFNGIQYQALYGGMSGQTPGTVVGWQALVDEWQFFNVYQAGDQVLYNGNTYEANYYTQGNVPEGSNVGPWAQWRLVQAVIQPGQTTHQFDANVLNATITINGVEVITNGNINTTAASSIGLTITKNSGNFYWQIQGGGRLRIRTNGTFQYQQGFSFDSLVVDLP